MITCVGRHEHTSIVRLDGAGEPDPSEPAADRLLAGTPELEVRNFFADTEPAVLRRSLVGDARQMAGALHRERAVRDDRRARRASRALRRAQRLRTRRCVRGPGGIRRAPGRCSRIARRSTRSSRRAADRQLSADITPPALDGGRRSATACFTARRRCERSPAFGRRSRPGSVSWKPSLLLCDAQQRVQSVGDGAAGRQRHRDRGARLDGALACAAIVTSRGVS